MLSAEKNQILTEVGPDKPMGQLLRRYWHPIGAAAELIEKATKPIRLMGEDLVVYKDLSGNFGLVHRRCAHRGADLAYGTVEKCGLRCLYHGWLYDSDGQCIAQPYEDMVSPKGRHKKNVRLKAAYPVQEKSGLLWAYLGPEPAPLLPDWEPFTWKNGFRQIVISEIHCNWFQCQENSIDPVHFEWLHENWASVQQNGEANAPRHLKLAFDEFEFGFVYKRVREGGDEDNEQWTTGRVALWPNCFFLGDHFEWRVPIDDTKTLSIMLVFNSVPKDREPFEQDRIPYWYAPLKDPETGEWITSHVVNQDMLVWSSQGIIADRTQEHLVRSDRGIIMMRNRFFSDLEKIKTGEDPKGLIRDQKKNQGVQLPIVGKEQYTAGLSQEEIEANPNYIAGRPRGYLYSAGQPEEIRKSYEAAMGFETQEYSVEFLTGKPLVKKE
ncbi:MAG: 5,5'-dehydrodivanillate O-demethylase [Rhodothermales bacterium]|jgi:5,5'-dehydrodivanillate O-demethylase